MDTLIFKPSNIIFSPILNNIFIINKNIFNINILMDKKIFYQLIFYNKDYFISLINRNDKNRLIEILSAYNCKKFIIDNTIYELKIEGIYKNVTIDNNLKSALSAIFKLLNIDQTVRILN